MSQTETTKETDALIRSLVDALHGSLYYKLTIEQYDDAKAALAKGYEYLSGEKTMNEPTNLTFSGRPEYEFDAERFDEIAVDKFAQAMKDKLRVAREKGRGGWQDADIGALCRMLREHLEKGDPVDVANFCMFLHYRKSPA